MTKIGLFLVVVSTSSCMVSMQRGLQASANSALEQGVRSLACMAKRLYTNDQGRDLLENVKLDASSDFVKKNPIVDPFIQSTARLLVKDILKSLNNEQQSSDELAQIMKAGKRIEDMGEKYVLQFEDLVGDYLDQSVLQDRKKLQQFCLSDFASSADIAFFFSVAANTSNYSLMNQLLTTKKIEACYIIDDAFSKAVKKEDYKLVNYLLKTGLISDDAIGRSFEEAVIHGNNRCVDMLLETGKISSSDIERAFKQAGKAQDFSLMDKLLLTGKIASATVVDLFAYAVVEDCYELIGYLLETKRIPESSLSDVSRQVAQQDDEKYEHILKYLQSRVQ